MKKFIVDVWKCLLLRLFNLSFALKKVRNNLAIQAEYSDLVRFRIVPATSEEDRLKQAEEHDARLTRVLAHQRFWEDQRILLMAARYFIPYQKADWSSVGALPCLTDDARANLMQQIRAVKRERAEFRLKVVTAFLAIAGTIGALAGVYIGYKLHKP